MRSDAAKVAADYAGGLAERGVTLSGIGLRDAAAHAKRLEMLFGAIEMGTYAPEARLKLLDLGCGPGFLLDYLDENSLLDKVDYIGVDITESAVDHAVKRWPQHCFVLRDLRDQPFPQDAFDHGLICGVFTSLCGLTPAEMSAFAESTLIATWKSVSAGLSFNIMSKHVDWEREDLFFWPVDELMDFLKRNLSRHVSLHMNYGLWETTVHVAKRPEGLNSRVPRHWSSGT